MYTPADQRNTLPQESTAPFDGLLRLLGVKPVTFDFITELPVEQCAERIRGQQEDRTLAQWFFGKRQVTVTIQPEGDHVYGFQLLKKQPKRMDVIIKGSVVSIAPNECHVVGEAKTSNWLYIPSLLMMPLILVVVALNIYGDASLGLALLMALVLLLGPFITSLFSFYDKRMMLERLQKAVAARDIRPVANVFR